MIERRQHRRLEVEFWASMKHPLLGTVTCNIEDMSVGGVSIKLDEQVDFFVMMELDVRIHGDGWDEAMPALPVQVVRVDNRNIALKFLDSCENFWTAEENEMEYVSESFSPLSSAAELSLELS